MSDCRCELHRSGKHPLTPTYHRGDVVLLRVVDGIQRQAAVDRAYYDDWRHAVRVFLVYDGETTVQTHHTEADIAELVLASAPELLIAAPRSGELAAGIDPPAGGETGAPGGTTPRSARPSPSDQLEFPEEQP